MLVSSSLIRKRKREKKREREEGKKEKEREEERERGRKEGVGACDEGVGACDDRCQGRAMRTLFQDCIGNGDDAGDDSVLPCLG